MPAENEKARWNLAAIVAFAPPRLAAEMLLSPTACAVGYALAALRASIAWAFRSELKRANLGRREER